MKQEMVCISCPLGCRLSVETEGKQVLSVTGNSCARGEEYARQEAVEPLRILTALMRMEGRDEPVSVKSSAPVPKRSLFDCARAVYAKQAKAPLHIGDVLIANVCDTGADIISTQEVL